MLIKRLTAAAAVALLLSFGAAGAAVADVPPPDCYVETCTLDALTANGGNCEACEAGPAVEDGCAEQMNKGFERQCAAWGASAYTEVWCEPDSGFTPAEDPQAGCQDDTGMSGDDEDSGCHVSLATPGGDAALIILLAALGALVIRKRSRWT